MTAAELRLIRLVEARTARMQPEIRRAWLRSIAILRQSLAPGQIADLIATGQYQAIFSPDVLDRAFVPMREALYRGVETGFRLSVPDIAGAIIQREAAIGFNVLSPRVRRAIETLEQQILATAKADVRETVRQAIATGLEQGQHPRTVARGLREVVGLSPSMAKQVENYRAALEGRDGRSPFDYALRNKRDDKATRAGTLTAERIDRMVDAYAKRRAAQHAETVSRTATLNAYREGQRASYDAAIEARIIDRSRAMKTWLNVGDDRVRPEHMQPPPNGVAGQTVPFDQPFSNGLQYPSEYNCRCTVRYFQASV